MKNAKKSMFITTILMVAVLIVAVSTATFAWYTAAAGGSVGTSTITSAKSQEANITIGWTAGDNTTSIEDLAPDKTVAPAVP
ncbi:MAG: hypothetical protein J6R44_02475, partial [Clostridia bacterium]|nr:hypothetical protein [Clostridia bacterium]